MKKGLIIKKIVKTGNLKKLSILISIFIMLVIIIFFSPGTVLADTISVASGNYHSMALKSDGTVWTWGRNNFGELGNGSFINSNVSVPVKGLSNVTAIDGGLYHSIALKNDGTVWTWGSGGDGQLGNGTSTGSNVPVQVTGISNITAIAGSWANSIALRNDGTVWTWGLGTHGELGNGTGGGTGTLPYISSNVPVQVTGISNITAIAGGASHGMALSNDGTVWTWGENFYGQLGDGTSTGSNVPVQVTGIIGITAIAAGKYHSMALKSDGTVRTWGRNNFGQLGEGTFINSQVNVPVPVTGLLSNVAGIAAGWDHSMALLNDGTVRTWGDAQGGHLGNGTPTGSSVPVEVSGLNNVTAIADGQWHSVVLRSDGTVWTWGYNFYGELGNGTTTDSNVPVLVPPSPYITANGLDGPLTINAADTLSVKVSLDAGGSSENADWWVAAKNSSGEWFHYSLSGSWLSGLSPTYQGPLIDVSSTTVLNTQGTPPGTYTIYIAVDMNMNGSPDTGADQFYVDSVVVTVTQ